MDHKDEEIAKLRRALEFYATEKFYDMTEFVSAARLAVLMRPVKNITIKGNPIMHDRGKLAREALNNGSPDGSAA